MRVWIAYFTRTRSVSEECQVLPRLRFGFASASATTKRNSPIGLSIGLLFYDVQVAGRTSHGGGCRCGCRVIPSEELRIKIGERDEALFVARLQFDAGVRQFLGER